MGLGELFIKGGWVMWPILACSVAALAVILDRVYALWKARPDDAVLPEVLRLVDEGKPDEARTRCERSRDPVAAVLAAGLSAWGTPHEEVDRRLERAAAEQMEMIEARLPFLATMVAVLPMLGFLGTILGLISAFMTWEKAGANVTVESLAAGIYVAMITTAAGLLTSIPYVGAYNAIAARAGAIAREMNAGGSELSGRHRLSARGAARIGGAA